MKYVPDRHRHSELAEMFYGMTGRDSLGGFIHTRFFDEIPISTEAIISV